MGNAVVAERRQREIEGELRIKMFLDKVHVKGNRLDLAKMAITDNMISFICDWMLHVRDKGIVVKDINLDRNHITSKGVSILFKYINHVKDAKVVSLAGNMIADECMDDVGEAISCNKDLKELSFGSSYSEGIGYGNRLSDIGVEILAKYVKGNDSLRYLSFAGNNFITDNSLDHLLESLHDSRIDMLNIQRTSITYNGQNQIALQLAVNKIKNRDDTFDISQRRVNDETLIKLCKDIKGYGRQIQSLNISGNSITSEGVIELFKLLSEHCTIRSIVASNNLLDDRCIDSLSDLLGCGSNLEFLNLGYNKITDNGIDSLATWIGGNTCLKEIRLYVNEGITDASVELIKNISTQTYLHSIALNGTMVSAKGIREINELLSVPIEERKIPILSTSKSAAKSAW